MDKKFLTLNDINAYHISFVLSNYVWSKVLTWDYFARDTIGKQLVRAADSIPANVAEGFGMYHKKEKMRFYRYSLGSSSEVTDWIRKARERNLLSEEEYQHISKILKNLPRELNHLIKFTNDKLTI